MKHITLFKLFIMLNTNGNHYNYVLLTNLSGRTKKTKYIFYFNIGNLRWVSCDVKTPIFLRG